MLKIENYIRRKMVGADIRYLNAENEFHRTDGPAIESSNGNKEWYINGKRHREDGPAAEWFTQKFWWVNDKMHRLDGPAQISDYGYVEWWINGRKYSKVEHNAIVLFTTLEPSRMQINV